MQYLFADVEASGLFDFTKAADAPGQPRLAQLGMIFVGADREIQSRHEFLIKPRGWMMSPEAEKLTGITTAHLEEHGVPVTEALRLYHSAIEARRIVCAFNAPYDLKVMRAEARHAGKPDLFMQTKSICLMQGCRRQVGAVNVSGGNKAPTLKEACDFYGIGQPAAHSALADAFSAYNIWLKVLERGGDPEVKDPYQKKPKKKSAGRKIKPEEEDAEAPSDWVAEAQQEGVL